MNQVAYLKYYIDKDSTCVTLHVSRMDDAFPEITISMDVRLLKELHEVEKCYSLRTYLPEIRIQYAFSIITLPISTNIPPHTGVLDITELCNFQRWTYDLKACDATTSAVWEDAWLTMRLAGNTTSETLEYMVYLTMIDSEGCARTILLGSLQTLTEIAEKAKNHAHAVS